MHKESADAFQFGTGYIKPKLQNVDDKEDNYYYEIFNEGKFLAGDGIIKDIDLTHHLTFPPILNQGRTNTCVAHCVSAILTSFFTKDPKK